MSTKLFIYILISLTFLLTNLISFFNVYIYFIEIKINKLL